MKGRTTVTYRILVPVIDFLLPSDLGRTKLAGPGRFPARVTRPRPHREPEAPSRVRNALRIARDIPLVDILLPAWTVGALAF